MEFTILYLIIPAVSLGLLFLKDSNRRRKQILNILLIINALVYLLPMVAAYFSTPEGESVFNENTGGGAFLWFYLILLPLCTFVLFVLLIIKVVFVFTAKPKE